MTLQPADLDRLEQLAHEAAPGPWTVSTDRSDDDLGACVDVEGPTIADDDYPFIVAPNVELRDARLIAALDPATVLALVEAARLGAAWADVQANLPAAAQGRAVSIGEYGPNTESPGQWVALVVWAPDYFGDGPTPAAALLALAEALRGRGT